jgi:ribosomal protein S18 acetylase RimI-like enzyme
MDLANEQAKENGYTTLSLVAFEQNKGAVNLYDKLGYSVVDQAPIVPHSLIRYEGIALLMVRSVE